MPPDNGTREFKLLSPWNDELTAQVIAEYVRQPHEKPFLAVANFVNPHNICEYANGRTLPEGDPGTPPPLEELPLLPINHEIPLDEPEIIRLCWKAGQRIYAGQRYDNTAWRQYLWSYYRMVEMVDRLIDEMLAALRDAGRESDTYIIFTSDHGDGCAAHRWNQKMVFYEEVIRVPFIISGPGIVAGRSSALTGAGLDLLPTLLDLAGIEVPVRLLGRSVVPLARGAKPADWRDHLVVESALCSEMGNALQEQRQNRGRCVIGQDWKYSLWNWGQNKEQLVDLKSDPGEMLNHAQSSRNREVILHYRELLQRWCRLTRDEFEIPGYEERGPQHGWAEVEQLKVRFKDFK